MNNYRELLCDLGFEPADGEIGGGEEETMKEEDDLELFKT